MGPPLLPDIELVATILYYTGSIMALTCRVSDDRNATLLRECVHAPHNLVVQQCSLHDIAIGIADQQTLDEDTWSVQSPSILAHTNGFPEHADP